MLDVVIPLIKNGSKHDNLELRFTLRSIEKYLKDYDQIIIVSDFKVDWLTNVTYIYCKDENTKTINIRKKIEEVFRYNTRNNIWLTNDDIFLLKGISTENYPFYYSNSKLKEILDTVYFDVGANLYKNILLDTINAVDVDDFKYFDIHYPIVYNNYLFKSIMKDYAWNNNGLLIKSLYANRLVSHNPIEIEDTLIKLPLQENLILETIENKDLFSIKSEAINIDMIRILNQLYPNKSKYEL